MTLDQQKKKNMWKMDCLKINGPGPVINLLYEYRKTTKM